MKVTSIAAVALIGGATASPLGGRLFLETDALAAEGVFKLGLNVAIEGYPNRDKCTLSKVTYRREWSVQSVLKFWKLLINIAPGPS